MKTRLLLAIMSFSIFLPEVLSLQVNSPPSLAGFIDTAFITYNQPFRANFSSFHALLLPGPLRKGFFFFPPELHVQFLHFQLFMLLFLIIGDDGCEIVGNFPEGTALGFEEEDIYKKCSIFQSFNKFYLALQVTFSEGWPTFLFIISSLTRITQMLLPFWWELQLWQLGLVFLSFLSFPPL